MRIRKTTSVLQLAALASCRTAKPQIEYPELGKETHIMDAAVKEP